MKFLFWTLTIVSLFSLSACETDPVIVSPTNATRDQGVGEQPITNHMRASAPPYLQGSQR